MELAKEAADTLNETMTHARKGKFFDNALKF
jgi:hypothetical protein